MRLYTSHYSFGLTEIYEATASANIEHINLIIVLYFIMQLADWIRLAIFFHSIREVSLSVGVLLNILFRLKNVVERLVTRSTGSPSVPAEAG
jgi:hypothetical protein